MFKTLPTVDFKFYRFARILIVKQTSQAAEKMLYSGINLARKLKRTEAQNNANFIEDRGGCFLKATMTFDLPGSESPKNGKKQGFRFASLSHWMKWHLAKEVVRQWFNKF